MHSQPTGDRADDGVDAASDGPDTRPATPERGGVDVLDLLLIRQPVVEGWTRAVRDLLADWADDNVDGDAHALLPVDGVTLATLFLDDGGFGWTTSTRPSTTPTAGKLGSPSGRCGACLRPPRRSSMRRWRRTARS